MTVFFRLFALSICLAVILPGAVLAIEGEFAVLQGLDKVTARVSTFEAAIGKPIRFGSLYIIVRRCVRTPPEEPPESTVYLDISEVRQGERAVDLFHGWMFASSPGLNALEHPVYDVWVLECKRREASSPG